MASSRHSFSSRERSALFRSSRDTIHNVLYIGSSQGSSFYSQLRVWLPENFELMFKPPKTMHSLSVEDAYLCAFVEMKIQLEQPEVIDQLKGSYPWLPIVLCLEEWCEASVLAGLRAGVQECFALEDGNENVLMHTIYCAVERKHAERLWARNQQLDQLSPLEQLAGGLAHELNNPMGWIGANMEFMREMVSGVDDGESFAPLKKEMMELLSECVQGIERINGIVRAVRDFAQTSKKSKETLEVQKILDQAIKLANGQIKRIAQVIMECEPGLPLIQGDRRALMDALMHLLLNAADAISENPRPSYDNYIGLFARLDGEQIELRVVDTGVGLSEHVSQHAMEPFFTTRTSQVGLGLSIVQDIVDGHQGTLSFEPAQPPWTTAVVMRLPIWHELPTLTSISQEYLPIENCEILVLEHEPELVRVCEQLFPQKHVVQVSSVDKALWALSQSEGLQGLVVNLEDVDTFSSDLRWSLDQLPQEISLLICAQASPQSEVALSKGANWVLAPWPFRKHFQEVQALLMSLFPKA